MTKTQLESLKIRRNRFMVDRSIGNEPSETEYIKEALKNNAALKFRPSSAITATARERVIFRIYGYSDSIELHQLFLPPKNFTADHKKWAEAVRKHEAKVQAYLKLTDPLMDHAAFSSKANAERIAGLLKEAAIKCGLHKEKK